MLNQAMDRLNRPRFSGQARFGSGRLAALVAGLAVLLAAAAALAPAASGADRVYWASTGSFGGAQAISFASLDGSGGADFNTGLATVSNPNGVALDLATNRIYWANAGAIPGAEQGISFANLDGSGGGANLNTGAGTLGNPAGVALDHAGGRVFWANAGGDAIAFASLDGSGGGGDLNTAGATTNTPVGVTIDRAAGRIYWANPDFGGSGSTGISFANLDGSGGGDLNTAGATVQNPFGVAIDPAAGRIYWANSDVGGMGDQSLSYANLDGSGGGDLNTAGATVDNPFGVAVDTRAGKLYWTNGGGGGNPGVSFANLDGSGGGNLNIAGATADAPVLPALLKTPLGIGAPKLSGGPGYRARLSCSQASWAPDQNQSRLFQAPTSSSFRWSRFGKKIKGAKKRRYRSHTVGAYRCSVTGENPAGKARQTSAVHLTFRLANLTHNKRRGTAKLIAKLPRRGKLVLRGAKVKKLARRTRLASKQRHLHKAALLIRARGAAAQSLARSGSAMLKVKVTYRPKSGKGGTLSRTVTLRQPPPVSDVAFPLGLGG